MNKKIELHLHLDGSIRVKTAKELLEADSDYNALSNKEFEKKLTVSPEDKTLVDYLKKFDLPIKLLQTRENIERISYELVEDLAMEDVIYAEIRIAPIQHIQMGLSHEDVVKSILKGFKKAQLKYPIKTGLILCAMRHLSPQENSYLFDLWKDFKDAGVVGLDLAGDEFNFPVTIFKDFFATAKLMGIPFTIHAGEADGPESVVNAINLGAKRIGHGIRAIESNDALDLLKRNNICLECCPISNRDTNVIKDFKDYPILNFLNKGIAVTLNTDNRTVSMTSLNKELLFLKGYLNITKEHIRQFNVNAVNHSFADKNTKNLLLKELGE